MNERFIGRYSPDGTVEEYRYFSTTRAIHELLAGSSATDVFSHLATKVSLKDLDHSHVTIERHEGVKDVANTLKTAISLDIATELDQMPITPMDFELERMPENAPVSPLTLRVFDTLKRQSVTDARFAIMNVVHAETSTVSTIFDGVSSLFYPSSGADKQQVMRLLANRLTLNLENIETSFKQYFHVLQGTYTDQIVNFPDETPYSFPTLTRYLEMMDTSLPILLHPASRDKAYVDKYLERTGVGVRENFAQQKRYNPDAFLLQKNARGKWKVGLHPEMKKKIEDEFGEFQSPYLISVNGCPAAMQARTDYTPKPTGLIVSIRDRIVKRAQTELLAA